jgi:hypothetical protein
MPTEVKEEEEDLGCVHLIYPKDSCTICNPFRVTIVKEEEND